jgi:hypothetical protein
MGRAQDMTAAMEPLIAASATVLDNCRRGLGALAPAPEKHG